MVKKFRSVLAGQTKWSLLSNVGLAVVCWGLLVLTHFYWAMVLLYIAAMIRLYVWVGADRALFRGSYWLFVILGPILLSLQSGSVVPVVSSGLASALLILVMGAILWGLLSVMRFVFAEQAFMYSLVHTGLLMLATGTIFSLTEPYHWGITLLLLVVILTILMHEALMFLGHIRTRRGYIMSMVVAVLGAEIAWVASLLTLGTLNATALLVLCMVLVRDTVVAHVTGKLTPSFAFRQLTVFIVVMILIFAATTWSL